MQAILLIGQDVGDDRERRRQSIEAQAGGESENLGDLVRRATQFQCLADMRLDAQAVDMCGLGIDGDEDELAHFGVERAASVGKEGIGDIGLHERWAEPHHVFQKVAPIAALGQKVLLDTFLFRAERRRGAVSRLRGDFRRQYGQAGRAAVDAQHTGEFQDFEDFLPSCAGFHRLERVMADPAIMPQRACSIHGEQEQMLVLVR